MRVIFSFVLLLGLGLAGFAVYMARDYIAAHEAELAAERARQGEVVPLTDVFVANRPIRYGERLTPEDVARVSWPEISLPAGAFTEAEALFPEGETRARAVMRAMEPGEPILAVKVTEPGQDAGVSSRLDQGMRAFAISVDVATGVSGFLRPGDNVDVYWTGAIGRDGDVTKLIEAGLQIVAVDQSADEERTGPIVARTVTVQANPRQVAGLAQAQATGRLSLALVGAADETVADAVEIDQKQLLGLEDEVVVAREEKEVCTIRTRRGLDAVDIPIPCSN